MCKFDNFDDYLRADYVIGHDVIGNPKVGTENSRLGLYGPENRFAIHGLTLSCVKVTHFVYSRIPKNVSLLSMSLLRMTV